MSELNLDKLYSIISNFVTREEFDTALGDNPSRCFVPFISKHTENMTLEQLKQITCTEWNNMAVEGIPHVSWNNGCWRDLYRAFVKSHNWRQRNYQDRWHETWYNHVITVWEGIGEDEGMVIIEDYSSPISFSSGGRTEYNYSIKKITEIDPEPTHIVTAISINRGNAYLFDQFAGTQEQCEDWVKNLYERGRHDGEVYTRMFPIDQPKR